MQKFLSRDEIRILFSEGMSRIFREEMGAYSELATLVARVNGQFANAIPGVTARSSLNGKCQNLERETHGAIRLGTSGELKMMRDVLGVMGLYPVGYYDLSFAGIPVHSTAFRPIDTESLERCPFRIFASLLRLELIEDEILRSEISALLSKRKIFPAGTAVLLNQFDRDGGFTSGDAKLFVETLLETFRWHDNTPVDIRTYTRLNAFHPVVADIAAFKGPHINHLTLPTRDIDAVSNEMVARGIDVKAAIEGPPPRNIPILLRQLSFRAVGEKIGFGCGKDTEAGVHTARFGEVEQRGLALTPKGRILYDTLLEEAEGHGGVRSEEHAERLHAVFQRFPDDIVSLRRQGLAYFTYRVVNNAKRGTSSTNGVPCDIENLIDRGFVEATPIVYQDFLPVSAAGIFRSNLASTEHKSYSKVEAQASFEHGLGTSVADPFELYLTAQENSIAAVRAAFPELSSSF